jgi:hypothetical protein
VLKEVQVSTRLSQAEIELLDDVCRRERRSRSSMIAYWVSEALNVDDSAAIGADWRDR